MSNHPRLGAARSATDSNPCASRSHQSSGRGEARWASSLRSAGPVPKAGKRSTIAMGSE